MTVEEAEKLLEDLGELPSNPSPKELYEAKDKAQWAIEKAYRALAVHYHFETEERFDNPCSRCGGHKQSYDVGSVISGTFKLITCPRCNGTGVEPNEKV